MSTHLSKSNIRLALVAISVVAAVSMGGGFAAGVVLAPLLLLSVPHASRFGALGTSVLAALLSVEVAWAATYLTLGKRQPWIWLVPTTAALLTVAIGVWIRLRSPHGAAVARGSG